LRDVAALDCLACGAKQVGEPLAKPELLLPRHGLALSAFSLALFIVCGYLAFWLFANDMRVGRTLLVSLLGAPLQAATEFLQARADWLLLYDWRGAGALLLSVFADMAKLMADWQKADPNLLNHRIFAWDAYRGAFYLSAVAAPLALLSARLAWRGARRAQATPAQYGGLRLAQASLAMSALLFVAFSAAGLSGIPGALERGRERRLAATRAMMYEHAQALQQYYHEHGSYPRETADLMQATGSPVPQFDYWEKPFKYVPYGTVAARNNAAFSDFALRSAGPDGEFGTEDDILMIDGVVVDRPLADALPASLLSPGNLRE
jgi:hypothetical protein